MTRRWNRLSAALVAIGALTLASCGSGGSTAATDGADSTLVVALGAEPPHLVRALRLEANIGVVALSMQESLVSVNRAKEVVPALAESWEVLDDGARYRFHLRPGVTWHDGEAFDSDDVVFTMENALELTGSGQRLSEQLERVEKIDDLTVDFVLTAPFAPFLGLLSPVDTGVLPEHIYSGGDIAANPANRAPVGTGPFRFESWEANNIRVTANPDYWGGEPGYGSIVFSVIPDANARVLALRNGDVDYINGFSLPQEVMSQVEGLDGVVLDTGRATTSMQQLTFNGDVIDLPSRKALYQAIDRDLISAAAFNSLSPPGENMFPEDMWAYDPAVRYSELYPYDPEAARAQLGQVPSPLRLRYQPSNVGSAATAEIIADNWRALGIEVELIADDATVALEEIYQNRNFDAFLINVDSRLDPVSSIASLYECDNGERRTYGNPSGVCDPALDELFAQAGAEQDRDVRRQIYGEVQARVAEEIPTVPLIQIRYTDAVRDSVGGLDEFFDAGQLVLLNWAKARPANP